MTVRVRPALFSGLLAGLVVLGACGAEPPDPDPAPALRGSGTLVGAAATGLGTVLVDGAGRTLYRFSGDTTGRPPTCRDTCAEEFPPYVATGEPAPASATLTPLTPVRLGTVAREGGVRQVSYAGMPLYYFRGDARPGETHGVGRALGTGTFEAVSTVGEPVTP